MENDMNDIEISIDHLETFSLAAQQNAYPLIKQITLSLQRPSEPGEISIQKNLRILLEWDSEIFESEEWLVDELSPGQKIKLQARNIPITLENLKKISDPFVCNGKIRVHTESGNTIYSDKISVDILPSSYWGGEHRQPELLAAFVKPRGVYVENLVREVTLLLEQSGFGRSVDGYQSKTRQKPYQMMSALWSVIFSQKFSYVEAPRGFAKQGQRIRLAADISQFRNTACLDTSLLFASCLEYMGLNPVIALTEGHAFAGAWLIEGRFPILTTDDPMDLRKRIDAKDLVLFETTLVTNPTFVSFSEACAKGRDLISEEHEKEFVYVIDISQARTRKIRPMSTELERDIGENGDIDSAVKVLPEAPYLPPVSIDEIIEPETPQTRIDMWQRRLLDLTKRNPLLNHSDRKVAVRLYCPDIATLEDMLSEGEKFKFRSSSDSPHNDNDRNPDVFSLETGNNLHRDYALEQLEKNVLMANQPPKKVDTSLVNLYRKSKTDLQEGGANTLFVALGFLKWKESPDADRVFKAPLILIPVELKRKSAGAPLYMSQLNDEDPLFNLTLIEFLQGNCGIDLNQFKGELPSDGKGVDVEGIWRTVRLSISEQPGFEVVEELVLGSFSFAKYLMWKDLRDRLPDLKENLFVSHLVDNPHQAYQQDTSFVDEDKVDDEIDANTLFTPLNADSSQLVAIDASTKKQDFVLEGPPGTGKSETIANIICHNLAHNKKVLFVAEKMAALNVVYRRLEKCGLDHLCLELHSNKANKRAVLDQLAIAATRRNVPSQDKWQSNVGYLKKLRDELNVFVRTLHRKTEFDVSVRQVISRCVGFKDNQRIKLPWEQDLNTAPIKDKVQLDKMLSIVNDLARTFGDVKEIDQNTFSIVKALDWSFSWQSSLISSFEKLLSVGDRFVEDTSTLSSLLNLPKDQLDENQLACLNSFVDLLELAKVHDVGYSIENGATKRLAALESAITLKGELDTLLNSIKLSATATKVKAIEIDAWISRYEQDGEHWLKGWFVKRHINKLAKSAGLEKIVDFLILGTIKKAKNVVHALENVIPELSNHRLWDGWDTSPTKLATRLEDGKLASELLRKILETQENPTPLYQAIKNHLVEGADFLETSQISNAANRFKTAFNNYSEINKELIKHGIETNNAKNAADLIVAANGIVENQAKLKVWVEWEKAKHASRAFALEPVIDALIQRLVLPDEVRDQTYTAFCVWSSHLLIDREPPLRNFVRASHEDMIKEFRHLDALVAETTSEYIRWIAAQSTPNLEARECPKEFGALAKELNKRSKLIPIRQLIQEMGEAIFDLTPCMMMSPLSVAQFLPSDFNEFDLVIFDEASQITTWDAVGAIARGKNVIVVGDPKQMPPTNFFGTSLNTGVTDEDLESILDQAMAARLPVRRLKGHYRSRHETLIAFSNNKYYDNSLVTYPSSETKESAVTLHRVDGIYTKGQRTNPIEAKSVVKEVVERLRDPSRARQTIGIVTLNSEQQRLIENLLDDARRADSLLEQFFQATDDYDPVFVKNLESVQGDERDVIILSLGYGPTEPGAKTMSMNFGPLNKSGGERRLNVAITRAKLEVLVFSSFDPSMIDLTRSSALAVEHMKNYLEYAERGPVALAEAATASHGIDQFDSDFEEAVANALRARGWKIQTQVGVSKFRVDLGVRHPDHPGRYLSGIECDGAAYHSSPSARDRDRVRHVILEGLGWRLIRLWSTDFFVDGEGSIDRIHKELETILEGDRAEAARKIKNIDSGSNAKEPIGADDLNKESANDDLRPIVDDQNGISTIESDGAENPVDKTEHEEVYARNQSISIKVNVDKFFDSDYRSTLATLARQILEDRNGIKLHTLALEIAKIHNLKRTSTRQLDVVRQAISSWSGLKAFRTPSLAFTAKKEEVVWKSPEDIVDEIPWRGLSPFGYERNWSEIPYPEQTGLARFALEQQPHDPIDMICHVFKLKRRSKVTLDTFQTWIDRLND